MVRLHRHLPEGLLRRSKPPLRRRRPKTMKAAHRRPMHRETILALEAPVPGEPVSQRPTLEESRRWLEQQVWSLPVLDDRSAEEILGYGDDGLCR